MKTKTIFKDTKVIPDKETRKKQELKNIIGYCFPNDAETEKFITKCLKENKTKLMFNRLKWFVKLSDFQEYDSVKTFFLIAMAETNIRLLDDRFNDNSNKTATADVRKFFSRFTKQDRDELSKYFFRTDEFLNKKTLKFDKVIDILLNVRHLLVHGKDHYSFRFHNGSEDLFNPLFDEVGTKNKNRKMQCELKITYNSFKKLMIKNAIENIKSCF